MNKLDTFAWYKGPEDNPRLFHQLGLLIFMSTNQSSISRGFLTGAQMRVFL